MDQRVKGGTPPTTSSPLDPTSPPEDLEQEHVAEKRRRGGGENGDFGKIEEEKRGAGKKREGDKGAVLELLIEGRCGSTEQQQLPFSARETSCSEGNVRLRIGLQAKRTKKPPKILESYVCKPTIRTYQRQGRGGLLRGDGEGGGQQNKTSSAPDETTREQLSRLDPFQGLSKQTASAASSPLAPSSSSSSSSSSSQPQPLSSAFTTASTPASVPAPASQRTKSAKQVKPADKTEVNSHGSSERGKKEKLPSINGQPVHTGNKSCSPTTEQTASANSSTQCLQALSAAETRSDGNTSKKHNGLVKTGKQKRLSNGKGSVDILGPATSSKIRVGKHSSSSSATSMDSSTRSQVPSSFHKESSLSNKSKPDSPSSPSVTPKPQSSPTVDTSSGQSPKLDSSLQSSPEKKREKEKKAKKEKRKEKKSKKDRLETERVKSASRKEPGKKKKKLKGKEGKSRNGKEKDEIDKPDDTYKDELKIVKGKSVKKKDKLSPDRLRTKDNNVKCGETVESGKLDKGCKIANQDRAEEADDSCKSVKQAEPATTTGDINKSKEQDILRHTSVSPSHPSSAPPSLSTPAHVPISPPSSLQEQDSRPLKKRKARRPSWTKLVHRAQRAENQEPPPDSHHNPLQNFPQNAKISLPTKATIQQTDDSHPTPSSSLTTSSSSLSSTVKPSSPKQSPPSSEPSPPASKCPVKPARKRGRPKTHGCRLDEPPPRLSPKVPTEGREEVQQAPVLEINPVLLSAPEPKSSPKKRGRPPKRPLSEDQSGDALSQTNEKDTNKDFDPFERGNRQLKIRRLINEMKKRKKRRLHKRILSECGGKKGRRRETEEETSPRICKLIEATTANTLSALSSSFGGKLGPQINVSKRGTIYMGKRRGRKPKVQTANLNSNFQNSTHSSLFSSPSETSLFSSNQPQPPPSHPFPSPSLTHSSGAQSPYSEGSLTEPTSTLLFPHPFSLPSPSSSCTSPRPPSSSTPSPSLPHLPPVRPPALPPPHPYHPF
ncbi:hypothetical protein LDENG_00220440 [Lucifuga dentata]|nr:hypothetical protein LDENG_00220440 [Lucifuga dentata]